MDTMKERDDFKQQGIQMHESIVRLTSQRDFVEKALLESEATHQSVEEQQRKTVEEKVEMIPAAEKAQLKKLLTEQSKLLQSKEE